MSVFKLVTDRVRRSGPVTAEALGVLSAMCDVSTPQSGALLVPYRAALDVPHALVEWVTMLIVTPQGDRRYKLSPSHRALAALVYLRKNDRLAQLAAEFPASVGTAHAYVHDVLSLLAGPAPDLTAALRTANAQYVLLDGTLAECGRAGDSQADYSGKHRRHEMTLQAVTA